MKTTLTASRTIRRPADEVFSFLADAENNPDWQRGMTSCEWITPPPVRVGSTYRQTASFLGRRVVSTFEVREFVPGRLIRFTTIESSFPIDVTRRVEPVDDTACRVIAEISGEPPGPGFLAPLIRRIAQRSVDADYDRLASMHSGST